MTGASGRASAVVVAFLGAIALPPEAIELRELDLAWVRGHLGDQPLAKYLEPALLGQLFAETP